MKGRFLQIFAAAAAVTGLAGGCTATQPPAQPQAAPLAGEVRLSASGIAAAWIPAGTFTMGSPPYAAGRFAHEGPQRQVTISSGFWMGVYPVTQQQWQAVMGSNPSYFSSNPAAGEAQGKRPVERVSWYESLVFANRLSIMEGFSPAYSIGGSTNPDDWGDVPVASRDAAWDAVQVAVQIAEGADGWRLATEAQWEHAARAGTVYRQGQQSDPDQIGWFSSNSGRITREVGLKPANAWGLHDMHGNVSEWVWDWFALYPAYAQTDPAGAASGSVRVLRGGSHGNTASADLPAQRAHGSPLHRDLRVGLRLVRPHKARP